MTTLNTFNDKDLLRNIRTGVLNPMVDQTNANTLDVNTLKGRVTSVDKRVGFLEPQVERNTTNLTALNRLAQGVAQQLSMAYDQAQVNFPKREILFTTFGGVESVLNLEPMFVDPIRTTIGVKDSTATNYHEVARLDFEGNAHLKYEAIPGSETAVITIDPMKGKIGSTEATEITEIEVTGNVGSSVLSNKKLTINIPAGGSGGTSNSMFIEPNPPELNKNLFVGTTKETAEASRDSYFSSTAGAADLASYESNIFKIILIEWDNGSSGSGDKLLQFQCRHRGSWVNPFHIDFSSFAISKHGIDELRDGNRVAVLEASTINDVRSIGTNGVDIFRVESSRNLKLKKLQSHNAEDMTVFTSDSDDVVFSVNQHWRGYYETIEAATSAIQSKDRVVNKTSIISKNQQGEDSIFVWDGSTWKERNISEHSLISADNSNFETLKGLKHGTHISFTKDANGYHVVEALSPVVGKVDTNPEERINRVEVSNKFATLTNGTLRLPVISAMSENAAELGQIKNIKQGDNVTFDYDANGVVTIGSKITPTVKVRAGSSGHFKDLVSITDPTAFSTITDSGELILYGTNLIGPDSSDKGYIKSFKAGENVTMDRNGDGTLTISSTGGSGGSDVKVVVGKSSDEVTLTKIVALDEFSKVGTDGVLTLHSVDLVGDDEGSQGYIKSIRSGNNTTLTLDSKGILKIDAFGGGTGGGGTIQAKVDGGNDYQDIIKIEALKSPATIASGILKLTPIEYVKANEEVVCDTGVKKIKAGIGIGFTEEETGVLHINNEGKLKGKIKHEDGQWTDLKQVDQINFTSDRTHGKFSTAFPGVIELDTRGFPAGATNFEELKTRFPVSDHAYRHGYTGADKSVYFAHETEWKLHNYYGMADEVKSLNSRFPVTTSTAPGTYDTREPVNKIYFVIKQQCPIPSSEYKEYGIIKDIVASGTKRSQMFYGLETGNTWYRIMSPTASSGAESEFLEWNLLNGLSEDYYSILTVPSMKLSTSKNLINGTTPLPWMVMQDPRCNVSVDGGDTSKFHINKSGKYDITACIHITANADTAGTSTTYTITLKDLTTGTTKVEVVTGVKAAQSPTHIAGLYPPVRVTFRDISATQANKYSLHVTMGRYGNINNVYLDSFKNYLVVQPSTSNTKQGVVIADNWRTAFGGFSCKDGYEVHVEGATNNRDVRVYGATVNTKLHNI